MKIVELISCWGCFVIFWSCGNRWLFCVMDCIFVVCVVCGGVGRGGGCVVLYLYCVVS